MPLTMMWKSEMFPPFGPILSLKRVATISKSPEMLKPQHKEHKLTYVGKLSLQVIKNLLHLEYYYWWLLSLANDKEIKSQESQTYFSDASDNDEDHNMDHDFLKGKIVLCYN